MVYSSAMLLCILSLWIKEKNVHLEIVMSISSTAESIFVFSDNRISHQVVTRKMNVFSHNSVESNLHQTDQPGNHVSCGASAGFLEHYARFIFQSIK